MDYSVLAFWVGAGVLAYIALLRLWPGAARVWFCWGGALVGVTVAFYFYMFLVQPFVPDVLDRFGIAFLAVPFLILAGGSVGYSLVYR
jgi:hypothetical protein